MVTPYYDEDGITIYHGDALDIMPQIMDQAAVMVTDPPYGVSYVSGSRGVPHKAIAGDNDPGLRDEVLALWATTRPDAPALVFGSWTVPRPVGTRHRLIWVKGQSPGMGDLDLPWGPGDEEIYVIGDGFGYGDGFVNKKRTGNWLNYDTLGAVAVERFHPTPKPPGLMIDLLGNCPDGATVLDPFMGSGATLRAAMDLGRPAIGIELDEEYCEKAATRVLAQRNLF